MFLVLALFLFSRCAGDCSSYTTCYSCTQYCFGTWCPNLRGCYEYSKSCTGGYRFSILCPDAPSPTPFPTYTPSPTESYHTSSNSTCIFTMFQICLEIPNLCRRIFSDKKNLLFPRVQKSIQLFFIIDF